MLKREARRKAKKTVTLLVYGVLIIGLVLAGFLAFKYLTTFAQLHFVQEDKIIKPLGASTTIDELRSELDKKNIILESLGNSSISATLTGKVKDGPLVYFSQNESAEWQVKSLYLIISRTTVDNKKPIFIDLRRARPIVKF